MSWPFLINPRIRDLYNVEYNMMWVIYSRSWLWPIQFRAHELHYVVPVTHTVLWLIKQRRGRNIYNVASMTYTTLLKWSIQRHVHDPTQRHAHGLINLEDVSYTTSCPWPSLPGIHAQYNGVPVTCITSIYHHLLVRLPPVAGADPGFQVRGGAIQNIAPSGVRREMFLG